MNYEKYIENMLEKGYGKDEVCRKIADKTGAPLDWVVMAYEVADMHKNDGDFVSKLVNGQLTEA